MLVGWFILAVSKLLRMKINLSVIVLFLKILDRNVFFQNKFFVVLYEIVISLENFEISLLSRSFEFTIFISLFIRMTAGIFRDRTMLVAAK